MLQHDLPFDPTYGCDEAALRAITPPPKVDGFADFWRATRAEADAVPLRLERQPLPSPAPGWKLSSVAFDSFGGQRIGGWLCEPEGACHGGLVVGHGYGGREAPDVPGHPVACLFPCMPGFHRSARPDLPNDGMRHVVHGIQAKETYILRACVAAMWSATRALAELRPDTIGRLGYHGGSFGGGLGALAAAWEPAWRCVRLDVPTFGHHPWRLRCRCNGSGEAVRLYHRRHPEVVEVLRFYDAAVAAALVRAPALVVPALFDPAVPPPGQWAVANALPEARIEAVTAGHFSAPQEAEDNRRVDAAWTAVLAQTGLLRNAAEAGK